MKHFLTTAALSAALMLGACANNAQNVANLTGAYDVAAAAEAAYAANPKANPATVQKMHALLAAAQGALLAWQNAPAGDTATQLALSAAIAALVAYEAQNTIS